MSGVVALSTIIFIAPLLYVIGMLHWVELPKAVFIQVGVAVIFFFWSVCRDEERVIKWPSTLTPIMLFFGWAALSLLWAVNTYDGAVLVLHWGSCALLIFLIVNLVKDPKPILIAGACSGFVVAVYGLLQVYGLAQYVPWIGDIHNISNILGSFFGHKNAAGRFMVETLPFAVVLAWIIKGKSRYVFGLMAVTILAFLYLCQSTAALVALACMVLFGVIWTFRKRKWVLIGTALLIILSSVIGSYKIDSTAFNTNARTEFILPVLQSGGTLAGVGIGNTRAMYGSLLNRTERTKGTYYQLNYLHNDYVQIWFELGYIGIAILLFCIYRISKMFFIGRKDPVKMAMAASVIGVAVTALFSFPAYMPIDPLMVGVCLGIAEL